jgi:ferric-dicitrate binding protein FerR (iron transport regulator)
VQKGKKFEVVSDHGITNVLGTTFNVYARNSDYRVSCISGNVKVTGTRYNQVVFLNPGQQAIINPAGNLEVQSGIDKEQVLSWLDNKFSFTSVSLVKVFEEIERQYGVVIRIPEGMENIYTGTFRLDTSIEETLNLVCKPFNLTFTRNSKDEYIITRIQ